MVNWLVLKKENTESLSHSSSTLSSSPTSTSEVTRKDAVWLAVNSFLVGQTKHKDYCSVGADVGGSQINPIGPILWLCPRAVSHFKGRDAYITLYCVLMQVAGRRRVVEVTLTFDFIYTINKCNLVWIVGNWNSKMYTDEHDRFQKDVIQNRLKKHLIIWFIYECIKVLEGSLTEWWGCSPCPPEFRGGTPAEAAGWMSSSSSCTDGPWSGSETLGKPFSLDSSLTNWYRQIAFTSAVDQISYYASLDTLWTFQLAVFYHHRLIMIHHFP